MKVFERLQFSPYNLHDNILLAFGTFIFFPIVNPTYRVSVRIRWFVVKTDWIYLVSFYCPFSILIRLSLLNNCFSLILRKP